MNVDKAVSERESVDFSSVLDVLSRRRLVDLSRVFGSSVRTSREPAAAIAARLREGLDDQQLLAVLNELSRDELRTCERFNRYLDRALVVPTIGNDPALAYFAERP